MKKRFKLVAVAALAAVGLSGCTIIGGPGFDPVTGNWSYDVEIDHADGITREWRLFGCLGGGHRCGEATWNADLRSNPVP